MLIPIAVVMIIQNELLPILYIRPGPPANPHPLIVLENTATLARIKPR